MAVRSSLPKAFRLVSQHLVKQLAVGVGVVVGGDDPAFGFVVAGLDAAAAKTAAIDRMSSDTF